MTATWKKAWTIGFLLLLLYVVTNELVGIFNDYVYSRLGMRRHLIQAVLWIFPFLAAFTASIIAPYSKILLVLSYVIVLPMLVAGTHFGVGYIGHPIDFGGFRGAVVLFQFYLVVGGAVLLAGGALGLLASNIRRR